MATVLEEVTQSDISAEHVERRVADWQKRVDGLYSEITSWLPSGWAAVRRRTVRMHEELMKTLNVPPRDLPILDLFKHGNLAASVEPRGLWIIGANGRLDLTTEDKHYIIVDKAENFHDPKWSISNLDDRLRSDSFDRNKFLSLLEHNA